LELSEDIPFRDIAAAIGRGLGVPTASIARRKPPNASPSSVRTQMHKASSAG